MDQIIKAYNKAVESNDMFSARVLYTRLKNLGYEQYKKLRMDTVFVPKN